MRHWTEDTDREAAEFFDGLPVKEIRRRQTLCDLQIGMAYRGNNADAVADLQAMSTALMDSMLRRTGQAI